MFDAVAKNISFLLGGYWITVKLTLFALAGGISLGILVGLGRISKKKWVYYPVTFYVNLIRNIPLFRYAHHYRQSSRPFPVGGDFLHHLRGDVLR
jgi:ABC-type amino acid transport system permease subunit